VARGVILDVVARGSVDDLAGELLAFLFAIPNQGILDFGIDAVSRDR
jgi:hypothetical protein